jgi:hypothetical protein
MGMLLGKKTEDNSGDSEKKSVGIGGVMTAALGDLMKSTNLGGGGKRNDSNGKGGSPLNTMMGKVESLMRLGGMFGVRKRAVSDHRKRSMDIGADHDPHHPEVIKMHSGLVMDKLRTFTDMSHKVADIFGVGEEEVEHAVSRLIEAADVGTGQVSVGRGPVGDGIRVLEPLSLADPSSHRFADFTGGGFRIFQVDWDVRWAHDERNFTRAFREEKRVYHGASWGGR